MLEIDNLATEAINKRTKDIDRVSTLEMAMLINAEDMRVATAINEELQNVVMAIDVIYEKIKHGGRLIYIGAGTSGRLGVLDAVECRPTYGVPDGVVIGLMAGGENSFLNAKEGAEDSREFGIADVKGISICEKDVLVGIAASGRTPYVLAALEYAKTVGAAVIGVCNNINSELSNIAEITIAPATGAEAISGSTRMKAGSAQKMVLNMLSTCVMIKLGKVYQNLMVDVQPTNEKLMRRAENIICEATGAMHSDAKQALADSGGNVKASIVSILCGCNAARAEQLLIEAGGNVENAVRQVGEN